MRTPRLKAKRRESGMSLLELLIAMTVLAVGVLASVGMVVYSLGSNFRNHQQSGSTVVAQMFIEKIMSVPVSTSPTLSITDCAGNAISITTAGTNSGAGATLLSSGDVDYSASAPAGYSAVFTDCGTAGRQISYDVRWNIRTPTNTYTKLVTVSARMQNTKGSSAFLSPVTTIRSMVGQGS